MKVLLISTSDVIGGAARAAYRLHKGLQNLGVISQMLVQEKYSDDKTVLAPKTSLSQGIDRAKVTFDTIPLKFYYQRSVTPFSIQWMPDKASSQIARISPDIINLHWIGRAFMQIETIAKLKRPLVWTLHDMWAFTGGCHYSGDCDRYTKYCRACPQLGSNQDWDVSRWVWQRKIKAWKELNLTIVTPSSWLAKCASSSYLFQNSQIEVIPNGLDIQTYRPIDRRTARKLLNLPEDKQLVLFGSLRATSDKRKGFHLLQPALQELSKSTLKQFEVIIFGASKPENPPDFGFKTHYLGILNDDLSLAVVYSAADVFVLPSTEENLSNAVMEALACGTPCVAFNIGGTPDMIQHQKNGYLAQPNKVEDLAQGIAWVLDNLDRHQKLSYYARQKVEQEFTLEIQASQYRTLFQNILDK